LTAPVTPLVGRDAELKRLSTIVSQAAQGAGSIVLISGEVGIGKTRLCAELSRLHRQDGGRVVLGRAAPEESSLAYAAVADALRVARRAEPAVWEAVRARAETLQAIAPELALEPGVKERPVDRPVLFEALLDAVEEAAGDAATLWVLDDIQWADDSTWEFVRYMARRAADLALVLAVTYRAEEIGPAHPWWPGLVRLKQESSVTSLSLPRLTAADGARLVRAIDPALPANAVTEIVERGAGTPLLVEELAVLASMPGRPLAIPDIVLATVRERSARLSPQARALLEVAAVAGLEVDAALLASILPGGRAEDLVSAGLLDQEEDRFWFRHPLFQEAAYEEVPAGRRHALHEQIAAAMADRGGYQPERIAAHLERAGRPDAALSVLEGAAGEASQAGQAGRKATLQVSAFQLAGRHQALAGRRADLERVAIGDLFSAGRWSELDPLIRHAWSRRHQVSDPARAWLAAVFCAYLFWSGSIRRALSIARDELAEFGERGVTDSAGALLGEAALIAWFSGDGGTARRFVDQALEVARRAGDLELELRARHFDVTITYGEQGNPETAVSRLQEAAALARTRGMVIPENWTRMYLSFFSGSMHGVKESPEAAERAGAWFWLAAMSEARLHLMEGNRDESEAIFGQIRHESRHGIATIAAWIGAKEARLYLHRGDLDEAAKLIRGPSAATEAASCGLIGAEWSAAKGWLAWEEGNLDEACAHLGNAGSDHVLSTYNAIPAGPAFLALRVDALMRLGRAGEAAAAISSAETFDLSHDRFVAAALAAARFRQRPSPERALHAATAAARAPWPWLHALVAGWHGEFLQDAAAAEGARKQFEAIGARRGVRRAEAVLRRLGVSLPRAERGSGALSPREMEVAELVAKGLSNPAIARRLYLSRPTVASHVAHILAKLGFSSRTQIAAWVTQRRAISS
jgi:DNA-binding CsgD family transcriptional regulator